MPSPTFGNSLLLWFLLLATLTGTGRAAGSESPARDVLVYKDGDRIQGRLIEQAGDTLVFQSDRFGLLRVPVKGAVVIKAEKPAGRKPAAPAAASAEPEHDWFSPAVLAARLRDYFGPWHGRLAFSAEVVSDTTDRSTLSLETLLKRKWRSDEVQLSGRYDFSETNHVTTTDLIKGTGLWQHDFTKNSFLQYRPTLEWNRANLVGGVPADYVLLQQEIGAGVSLLTQPTRKLRAGVSENLFDLWNTAVPEAHQTRTAQSMFVETELRLPWRMTLTERGVYYYSFSTQDDGWENRIELNKKFTETLSTAIRHEFREGGDLQGTVQDYTRLKLLFGLDF